MHTETKENMKTKLLALAAASIILVGCGSKSSTDTTTTTTTTTLAKGGVDGYFNEVLNAYPNAINIHGRNWIIEFGQVSCGAIDEGMSLNDLLNMVPAGADGELVGFMIRHAILNICPHNQWFIDAASRA
jgi:hypothetical protein